MAYGDIGDTITKIDTYNDNREYIFTCISTDPILYICPTPLYDSELLKKHGQVNEDGIAYYTVNDKKSLQDIANVVTHMGQDCFPTFTHMLMYQEPFEFKQLLTVLDRYAYKKILKDNKLYIQLCNDNVSVTFPLLGYKNSDNFFCINQACIFGIYSILLYDLDNTKLNGIFLRLLNTVSFHRIIPYDMFQQDDKVYCPSFKLYSKYQYCSINQYKRNNNYTYNSFQPVRVPIYMYLTKPKYFTYRSIKVTRYAQNVQSDINLKKIYIRFFFSLNTFLELTFLVKTELTEFTDNTEFNYGLEDFSNENTILQDESRLVTNNKSYMVTKASAYYNKQGEYVDTCLFIAAITTTNPDKYSKFQMLNTLLMPSF